MNCNLEIGQFRTTLSIVKPIFHPIYMKMFFSFSYFFSEHGKFDFHSLDFHSRRWFLFYEKKIRRWNQSKTIEKLLHLPVASCIRKWYCIIRENFISSFSFFMYVYTVSDVPYVSANKFSTVDWGYFEVVGM